jgi:hypothetical protein
MLREALDGVESLLLKVELVARLLMSGPKLTWKLWNDGETARMDQDPAEDAARVRPGVAGTSMEKAEAD